jgi:hypothetical protein
MKIRVPILCIGHFVDFVAHISDAVSRTGWLSHGLNSLGYNKVNGLVNLHFKLNVFSEKIRS